MATLSRMTRTYYGPSTPRQHCSSSSTMALTSSIPCIDRLAFQLSLHRLDERRSHQPAFRCFSWSEPFDLDFAGKTRSNPKRSRSLPDPLASKRKEIFSKGKDENQNSTLCSRETLKLTGKAQDGVLVKKAGFQAYAGSSCSVTKNLTFSLHKYSNETGTHKESEGETSDEELSVAAKKFLGRQSPTKHFAEVLVSQQFPCGTGSSPADYTQPRMRKRVFDGNELIVNSSKRARPRLNFEKMLSSAVMGNVQCTKVLFEDTFFKPIEPEDS